MMDGQEDEHEDGGENAARMVERSHTVNGDPTEAEFEGAYIPGEYVSLRTDVEGSGYVLLVDGTYAPIESLHADSGQQVASSQDARFVCAIINGLVFAYPIRELMRTLH